MFYPFIDNEEILPGEYFLVQDKETTSDHIIQFTMSLRGKPAILGKIFSKS
jgi:hypothetical protein